MLANPGDLSLRKHYADSLSRAGNPRGEFIHLQLLEERTEVQQSRMEDLLAQHRVEWLGSLAPYMDEEDCSFANGFLDCCTVEGEPGDLMDVAENPLWATVDEFTGPACIFLSPALLSLRCLNVAEGTTQSDLGRLGELKTLEFLSLFEAEDLGPLANLSTVRSIFLDKTEVSNLSPLASLTELQFFTCMRSQVSDVAPLAGLRGLKTLALPGNPIAEIGPLSTLLGLEQLNLYMTPVSDISPLIPLSQLRVLSLGGTHVVDLDALREMTQLEELALGETNVGSIEALAHLTNLTSLDLRGTQVSNFEPLALLTKLQDLDLAETTAKSLAPLLHLRNLEDLRLPDYSYDDPALPRLEAMLPEGGLN